MRIIAIFLLLVVSNVVQATDSPVVTVSQLYHDFAWEAVMSAPDAIGLADQPESVLVKYFTPRLAKALADDATCKESNQGICALDFVPLWSSQDPEAQGLSIAQGRNKNEVRVEFTRPSAHEKTTLIFRVISTRSGWRVADIIYPSGHSLVKLLANGK